VSRLECDLPDAAFVAPAAPGLRDGDDLREDAQLLRRAITGDQLNAIVRRIYPQTDAADERVAG